MEPASDDDAPPQPELVPPGMITNSSHRVYLRISFRKSTPPQNRQLIVYYYYLKY